MNSHSDVMTFRGDGPEDDASLTHEWCPLERALTDIGTNSALLLLREIFWGARRFDDLVRRADLTEQIASIRLKQLVGAGILTKQPYREPGQRTRYEYVLTGRGRELFPVIVSLIEFGLLLQGDSRRLDLVHGDRCGAAIVSQVQCTQGHLVPLDQVHVRFGRQQRR